MQSSQSTDETTCLTSAALIAAGSPIACPVVLVKTASLGGANAIGSRNAAKPARAGYISFE
jgi:hypothetical protein